VQLIPVAMFVSTLASETVATATTSPSLRTALLRNVEPTRALALASLPPLPLVPEWSQLLALPSEWAPGAPGSPGLPSWRLELTHPPLPRLGVRELYTQLARLPRIDRVGRFAHIDFPLRGLSAGPELLRFALDPPRENYPRAQELTPGWSLWYKPSAVRWAVGVVTGTRFLMAQQSNTVIDPITSEARWAFFLP
jgi:hypothetical protein